jgi:hypothetical protein
MAQPTDTSPKSPRARTAVAEPAFVVNLAATEPAWKAHEGRFRALARSAVKPAALDITQAASIAIAAVNNLLSRRAELEALYRAAPVARFEAVIGIALAVQHADLLARVASDRTSLFADIFPRMTELRGLLLDDLDIQVKRGRCTAKFVSDLRKGDRDAADFANDLNDAANWYEPRLGTDLRTTIEAAEVAEARELAAKALARLALKVVPDATKEGSISPTEMRARAFTVLEAEYEEVRKYGAALFWSSPNGWESYLPSLWVGRGTGGGSAPPVEPAPSPVNPT